MRHALSMRRPARPRLDGLRVLLLEDEPDAREFLVELLSSRGASVDSASTVSEAWETLARHLPNLPDVIVSDIGLPDVDGYQFARWLRRLPRERGGTTPLVALTAYVSPQDRRRALEAGYDHHLAKPVNSDELVGLVERLGQPSGT